MSPEASEEDAFPLIGPWPDGAGPRAAIVALKDAEGRLLMQLRDDRPGVVNAGLWGFFGGAVEPGETLADAAARELAEELSIRPPPGALSPLCRLRSPAGQAWRVFVFAARIDVTPAAICLREGAGFGFFTARQLDGLPVAPVLKPVFETYLRT